MKLTLAATCLIEAIAIFFLATVNRELRLDVAWLTTELSSCANHNPAIR